MEVGQIAALAADSSILDAENIALMHSKDENATANGIIRATLFPSMFSTNVVATVAEFPI